MDLPKGIELSVGYFICQVRQTINDHAYWYIKLALSKEMCCEKWYGNLSVGER